MNKLIIPVEYDESTEDYFISFSKELLQKLNWKEGDTLEWIDLNNGSYEVKKCCNEL